MQKRVEGQIHNNCAIGPDYILMSQQKNKQWRENGTVLAYHVINCQKMALFLTLHDFVIFGRYDVNPVTLTY